MVWHVLLVIILGTQQVEFTDSKQFDSRDACNKRAVELATIPIMVPAAVTCISEVRA